jgi:hypothetical protein
MQVSERYANGDAPKLKDWAGRTLPSWDGSTGRCWQAICFRVSSVNRHYALT